jgi:ACR3 family arsenite efflux pump ArsB
VVSWLGVVIYIFLLFKAGKILRQINNQYNKYIKYNPLLIYFFKISMVSLLMIGFMQVLLYFSSIYQINDILSLSLLVTSGLLIYVLTTFVLGYIPQQLLNFYISKFEKAK